MGTPIRAARAALRDRSLLPPPGGGSRGVALLDRTLILSPRGTDTVIAAHELARAEFRRRIGLAATLARSVPQWFDEGLAVVVSDGPRSLAPTPDRCRAEPGGDLPTARSAWIEQAGSAGLYARAACRVSRWLDAHGARRASCASWRAEPTGTSAGTRDPERPGTGGRLGAGAAAGIACRPADAACRSPRNRDGESIVDGSRQPASLDRRRVGNASTDEPPV